MGGKGKTSGKSYDYDERGRGYEPRDDRGYGYESHRDRGKGYEREDQDSYRGSQQWTERSQGEAWGRGKERGGKDRGRGDDLGYYARDRSRGEVDDPWSTFESLLDDYASAGKIAWENRGKGDRYKGEPDPVAVSEWFDLLKGKAAGRGYEAPRDGGYWDEGRGRDPPPESFSKGKGKGKSKGKSPSSGEVEEGKIFVGGLPADTTEASITAHFESFGAVKEVILKKKPGEAQKSRGFGFVSFHDNEAARAVIDNFDYNMFEGKWIDCKPAVADDRFDKGKGGGKGGKDGKFDRKRPAEDSAMVVVDGLPESVQQADLKQFFEFYGVVQEVQLDKGSAWITFESPEIAASALSNPEPVEIHGAMVTLRPPDDGPPQRRLRRTFEDGPPSDKVFVMNVPEDQTEESMAAYYGQFGTVKELHLPFDTETAKIRGFCFITFETSEAAAEAVKSNNVGDARLDYGQKRGGKAAEEAPAPTDVFLKVIGLPTDPKQRDVFKLFFNYSLARIRDLDNEAVVEFCSAGECAKAFKEKQGGRMGKERVVLAGATRDDFMQMKASQEAIGILGRSK
mmetsp:Transcript_24396/g.44191  ORF Transcript_24396/g.44191 Transcript_24396/m.44191 type:complete len:567 (-) Transcript_24396:23-1723(-)